MKKSVIAALLVMAVGVSNMAYAGFGIPGLPKAPKSPVAQSAQQEQAPAVNLDSITGNQTKILKYMCGALYAQLNAYNKVKEAFNQKDDKLLQVASTLKHPSNSNAKKAQSVVKKASADVSSLIAKADKAKLESAKLAAAVKSGRAYMQASYVNYGVVAAAVPGALSEATGAVKNLTKNPAALGKVNGAISTFKMGSALAGLSKEEVDKYDKLVGTMKSDGLVTDADLDAAPSANVDAIATDCLNFVGGE